MQSDDDLFSALDALAEIAANEIPKTEEEQFYHFFTVSNVHKLDNLLAWLYYNFSVFMFLTEDENVSISKTHVVNPLNGTTEQRKLTKHQIARLLVKYYLYANHLPHFQLVHGAKDKRSLNIEKILDLLMENEKIKTKIANKN